MVVKKYVSFSYIVKVSWKSIFLMLLLSTGVSYAYLELNIKQAALDYLPIGTLGTAIAILLGFRNNSAYDRFWEGRKIWGEVVNYSRTFSR